MYKSHIPKQEIDLCTMEFNWKKHWGWVAAGAGVILLIIIIILTVLLLDKKGEGNSKAEKEENGNGKGQNYEVLDGNFKVPDWVVIDPPITCSKDEGTSDFKDYQIAALELHNKIRADHQSPPLKLSPRLNVIAESCAEYYMNILSAPHTCPCFNHRECADNISLFPYVTPAMNASIAAANGYYREVSLYDFSNPGFQHGAGHFTQMIWAEVKELGVGYFSKYYPGPKYGRTRLICVYDKTTQNSAEAFRKTVKPKMQ